jgi:hypothetical protein
MREIKGETSREACATSFEMDWTYPTETPKERFEGLEYRKGLALDMI